MLDIGKGAGGPNLPALFSWLILTKLTLMVHKSQICFYCDPTILGFVVQLGIPNNNSLG